MKTFSPGWLRMLKMLLMPCLLLGRMLTMAFIHLSSILVFRSLSVYLAWLPILFLAVIMMTKPTPVRLFVAVLLFTLGLFLAFVVCNCIDSHAATDPNSNVVFYQYADGATKTTSFDILWSDTEDGTYGWINSSHFSGVVSYNPLVIDRRYTLEGRPASTGYYKGVRVYGTFLGSFDKGMTLSLGNIPTNLIEEDWLNSGLFIYYKDEWQVNYADVTSYYGISSFVDVGELNTLEISVTWDADNITSQYDSQATTYSYNIMIEFLFAPCPGSQAFAFDLNQYYGQSLATVSFSDWFEDTDLGKQMKNMLYNNPVLPVQDFINGNNISLLFGSSLPSVINPFLNLFYNSNVHTVWKALANFSFGMMCLLTVMAFLRRAHFKGGDS